MTMRALVAAILARGRASRLQKCAMRRRSRRGAALALFVAFGGLALSELQPERSAASSTSSAVGGSQAILALQRFRSTETASIEGRGKRGTAELINLDPNINAWFVLTLDWDGDAGPTSYHIENPDPLRQQLRLINDGDQGLVLSRGSEATVCKPWADKPSALERAASSSLPYAPVCNGRLYLRNRVGGRRTELERVTEFLRDHVWSGESVIGFVRNTLYGDAFREAQSLVTVFRPQAEIPEGEQAPTDASVNADYADKALTATSLGIDWVGPASRQLEMGRWYPVRNAQGVYISAIQPQAISNTIIEQDRGAAARLDSMEASATDYLVAFDLSQFELGFSLGTDHPRLGWSVRVSSAMRKAQIPGPDGFDTASPLVRTGMVSPAMLGSVVATFTGGFKREHGAFKYGELASANYGSHYGFIEEGVVLSSLQPGLATLYSLNDGSVEMKTWTEGDNVLLGRIRFARQNGVALVARDPRTNKPAPGPLVTKWGPGNWSGSADEMLRTLRAGVCMQVGSTRRFLIYGYFSTATPSAMAEVFRAYDCSYAMLLDMNALEHTYLAIYTRQADKVAVQHLVSGMAEVDRISGDQLVPRFVGFPDNRDFFYLSRRRSSP